jgi:hypothetical protein
MPISRDSSCEGSSHIWTDDTDAALISRPCGTKSCFHDVPRTNRPGLISASLVQISLAAPADFISQPRSLVLDGCPMFAQAYSGFPVELAGVGELHAAFLNESRTRGCWWCPVQEIRIHGPKTDFSNAFTPCTRILALRAVVFLPA